MRVSAKYDIVKRDFLDKIEVEQKKYPFTAREQMFIDTIIDLIQALQEVDADRYY